MFAITSNNEKKKTTKNLSNTSALIKYRSSAVASGGPGGLCYGGAVPPLMTTCAPHFGLLKLLFLKHHVTARQLQ